MTEQITGPSVSVAFKDGQPTPAAHAFAKKAGVDVSALERVTTPKGEYLSAKVTKKGRSAQEILAEFLPKEIASIYWPKNMYWRKPSELFRASGALAGGHARWRSHSAGIRWRSRRKPTRAAIGFCPMDAVQIPRAGAAYIEALEQAKVLSREAREKQIRKALDAATRTIPGARWREDKPLLDTVVNLTEWPSAILGSFDPEFLELPEEVLVTVMRDHQKYFAVEDGGSKLLPHFLAVLNTDGDPQGIIRHGHERVLRARFNDARFFWQTDQKHPLRERAAWLKKRNLPERSGQLLRKNAAGAAGVQLAFGNHSRRTAWRFVPGVVHKARCWPRPT